LTTLGSEDQVHNLIKLSSLFQAYKALHGFPDNKIRISIERHSYSRD